MSGPGAQTKYSLLCFSVCLLDGTGRVSCSARSARDVIRSEDVRCGAGRERVPQTLEQDHDQGGVGPAQVPAGREVSGSTGEWTG